jgi:hypothetical protein
MLTPYDRARKAILLGLSAEGKVKMEKKANNGSCGCTEGRIMERDTQKGTHSGAKDKIAAQTKDSGPGPPS